MSALHVGDRVWVTKERYEGEIVGLEWKGKGANITGYRVRYMAEGVGWSGEQLKQPAQGVFKRNEIETRFA